MEVKHHSSSLEVLGIGSKETEADVARGLMPALNLLQAQRNMLQYCQIDASLHSPVLSLTLLPSDQLPQAHQQTQTAVFIDPITHTLGDLTLASDYA